MTPEREGLKGKGEIRAIEGPMFSGKSETLIQMAERFRRAAIEVQVFKHPLDDRYSGESKVNSHSERSFPCEACADPLEVYQRVRPETQIVIWDEFQFYTDPNDPQEREKIERAAIAVVEKLALEGRLVIVAGLGLDFKGEGFGPMPALLARADSVTKLTAVCAQCRSLQANRTQRLVDGEPAPYDSPLIVVGAKESYEARCRDCHQVPGTPSFEELVKTALPD